MTLRFQVPEQKTLTYEMTIPIRWGDMDPMSHVNNTVYFRYFEVIRIEWCRSIGAMANPNGEGIVIVNTFCNFIRQLEYPGDILARHYVADVGRSSFDVYMTLERTDKPGVIHAEGGARTVWVDFPKQKSMPIPEWLRAKLLQPSSV